MGGQMIGLGDTSNPFCFNTLRESWDKTGQNDMAFVRDLSGVKVL